MKSKKFKTRKIIVFASAMILVIIGFSAGFLVLRSQKSQLPPPRIITTKDDLSKWQKYENKNLNFSFLYPPEKIIRVTAQKDLKENFLWQGTIETSGVALVDLRGKSLIKWASEDFNLAIIQKKFEQAKIKAPLVEYIKLNDRDGIRIHFLNTAITSAGIDTILSVGDSKVFIASTPFKNNGKSNKDNLKSLKEHNGILASFKFLDQSK